MDRPNPEFVGLFGMQPPTEGVGTQLASQDNRYRYSLTRWFGDGGNVLWVMLNPSTADEHFLDPTLRRCLGFSKLWGRGFMTICNLYAFRATDPRRLASERDREGILNNATIAEEATKAQLIVCAWGAQGVEGFDRRATFVTAMLRSMSTCPIRCLGVTKAGHPRHPLYLPYTAELQDFL